MAQSPPSSRKRWQAPAVTTVNAPKPKGSWFDEAAVKKAMDFFALLPFVDGEKAGQPLEILPWQYQEVIRPLFGWMRKDGTRLYRELYLRVARKNSKSTLCAAIAGYLTFADDEPGARVYAAAVDREQAGEVFQTFSDMVKASLQLNPEANKRVRLLRREVEYQPQRIPGAPARFHILSGDTGNKDGLNISGGIIDELHAHPTDEIYRLLNQGTASRRQPLIVSITTAGVWAPDSICVERDEYTRRIAKGILKDPAFLGIIYELDEGDDWADEKNWIKANPGLGVTLPKDFLRRERDKAKASVSAQNAFRMKHTNEWMQQNLRWIELGLWDSNAYRTNEDGEPYITLESELEGRDCYGGLDIGSVSDLTAWAMVFPDSDGHVDVLMRFFAPEGALEEGKQNAVIYREWQASGVLQITRGNSTDYAYVREQIVRDAQRFNLLGLNIDSLFQGAQLGAELVDEGLNVATMRQGFLSYGLPMKEFERRLNERQIHHQANPALRFCADNVVVAQDAAGLLKPAKDKSRNKIDGISALVMAFDWLTRGEELDPRVLVI